MLIPPGLARKPVSGHEGIIKKPTIFILDDDPGIVEATRIMLEAAG